MNKQSNYTYILILRDGEHMTLGSTDSISETLKTLNSDYEFRLDRSFLLKGNIEQVKNLTILFQSLLHNFLEREEGNTKIYNKKGLEKLREFLDHLNNFKIKVEKIYVKKVLLEEEIEASKVKIEKKYLNKTKKNFIVDFNILDKKVLERKYNKDYLLLQNDYFVLSKSIKRETKRLIKTLKENVKSQEKLKDAILLQL